MKSRHIAAISLFLMSSISNACGPEFPLRLFSEKDKTFSNLPTIAFSLENLGITKALPDRTWKPGDTVVSQDDPEHIHTITTDEWEKNNLAQNLYEAAQKNRSGNASPSQRSILSPIILAYTDGVSSKNHNDTPKAIQYFRRASEIQDPKYSNYKLMALYELGRTLTDDKESSITYSKLRQEVSTGTPDPLGLALSSLGEEAGRYWNKHRDLVNAVRLYAQQGIGGDASGIGSLRVIMPEITNAIMGDSEMRSSARMWLRDPLVRGAYISYMASRGLSTTFWNDDDRTRFPTPVLNALTESINEAAPGSTIGASRLASIAWRTGHYDWAEKWSSQANDALSWWIRAKLAMRSGDRNFAKLAYQNAFNKISSSDSRISQYTNSHICYLEGEMALIDIKNGNFLSASKVISGKNINHQIYWLDIAYLAERLLTIDELRTFLEEAKPVEEQKINGDRSFLSPLENYRRLQYLYARRLLREGHGKEAVAMFADNNLKKSAENYQTALDTANNKSISSIERATAWFEAGKIARNQGMELLGYEGDPDYAIFDGFLSMGIPSKVSLGMQHAEEARWDANRPPHNYRFHYRSLAADYAENAASLLPNNSQAYGAVLCFASNWTMQTETKRAQKLAYLVLRNGIKLPKPKSTEACPEPDFRRKAAK